MPNSYYTCNLLPLDLVVRTGYSPRWLGNHLRDANAPAQRDALSIHPMTCPYVTKLAVAAEEVLAGRGANTDSSQANCLVVPGGCDAMRRLGDLLISTYPDKVFVLTLSRSSGSRATAALASELARMEDWLQARLLAGGQPPTASDSNPAATTEPPAIDYPHPPAPGGVFLVSGPLSNDSLLRLVHKLGSHVSGLESCTSPDRWRPLAPAAAAERRTKRGTHLGQVTDPDYQALAAYMMAAGVCPRRSTVERREYLKHRLDESQPSSIIYARQSFCDPGAYDGLLVAELARERHLPYLEIEVDFPFDAGGPLRTRVEAFLEAQLLDDDLLTDDDLFDDTAVAGPPADVADTGAPTTPAAKEV